jgi:hypothetical protein
MLVTPLNPDRMPVGRVHQVVGAVDRRTLIVHDAARCASGAA